MEVVFMPTARATTPVCFSPVSSISLIRKEGGQQPFGVY